MAGNNLDDTDKLRELIASRLAELIPSIEQAPANLHRSMRYSLLAPGKRIRPLLMLLITRHYGGEVQPALNAACAIEMVHTASLILDDLPAMDNASTRRGQAANHRVFGEATALLAAISLLSRAFGIIAEEEALSATDKTRLSKILSDAIGTDGLAGGQEQDLKWAPNAVTRQDVKQVHMRKTAALFAAAGEMGAVTAGVSPEDIVKAGAFGAKLGLAFQIIDDLIDATGTVEGAGKDVAKDGRRPSLVLNMGIEAAAREAHETLREAQSLLTSHVTPSDTLMNILSQMMADLQTHLGTARRARKMTG